MCEHDSHEPGAVVWQDLTVGDAAVVKNFYSEVVGWKPRSVDMGGYLDYEMLSPAGDVEAGICHAKGDNAKLPAQWLIYIRVEDIQASVKRCEELGGEILDGPRALGQGVFCVIKDPAGAVAALYQE